MLDAASVISADTASHDHADAAQNAPTHDVQPHVPAGRYGEKRAISLPAVVGVVAGHAVVLAAALFFHPAFKKEERTRLKVVEMQLDAPPPAPPKPQQAKPVKLEMKVSVPRPPIMLASAVEAPPPAPVAIAAPIMSAPPEPPAPPAPPRPPSVVQGGNLSAQMVSGKPPRYPIECRRKREQGTVVLAVTLGTDGRVDNISIARSSGTAALDNAARDAVKSWRWSPVIRDGVPVMVRGMVEIPFVLQG